VPSVLFTRTILEVDFIYWCHFITDMIVYTYAEFGLNYLINKWNITHWSVLHWEFASVCILY